ncbi:MAG: hypothetical protein LIP77_05650 [Planctomycetes bacterium]|nr:hypothetical protein [Planctomycetota bacterium]
MRTIAYVTLALLVAFSGPAMAAFGERAPVDGQHYQPPPVKARLHGLVIPTGKNSSIIIAPTRR